MLNSCISVPPSASYNNNIMSLSLNATASVRKGGGGGLLLRTYSIIIIHTQ